MACFITGPTLIRSGEAQVSTAAQIRIFQLKANDVVYDRVGQRLYASVPSSFGLTGNSVIQVNPNSLTVGSPIFVGSEPGRMSVSDDGRYLYVALGGAASIRRIELNNQFAGLQFWPGNRETSGAVIPQSEGPYFARDLKVLPGQPNSVAVVRHFAHSTGSHGVAVYRDGQRLPNDSNSIDLSFTYRLAFSDSASKLYGIGDTGDFLEFGLNSNGVSYTRTTPYSQLINSGNGTDIVFGGGRIYTTNGLVIDPEVPSIVGTFSLPSPHIIYGLAPDPQTGRLYVLGSPRECGVLCNYTARIFAFDLTTLSLIDSIEIPGLFGQIGSFVRWGANGFAFRTFESVLTTGQVVVIRSSIVPSSEPIDLPVPTQPVQVLPPTVSSTIRQIELVNDDLIYDKTRNLIYATVPSFAGPNGNSVTAINPTTGEIGASHTIGIDPGKLAISRNDQYLYAAMIGEHVVRRFNLESQVVDGEFSTQPSPGVGTGTYVVDMAVMPDEPTTVVLTKAGTLSGMFPQGIVVYRNGTVLTQRGGSGTTVLETSDEPLIFYTSDSQSLGGSAYVKWEIGLPGVLGDPFEPHYVINNAVGGYLCDVRWDGGRLFDCGGRVVDARTTRPTGKFDVSPFGKKVPLADTRSRRAYILTGLDSAVGSTWTLRAFDTDTYLPVASIDIPGVRGVTGSLIRWGTDGIAFGTGGNQVFLIQSPLFNPGNSIDRADYFVHQQYLDFLQRQPDPDGLAFWTNQITSCGADTQCIDLKRTNASAAFFLSIEFQETGYFAYRMYKAGYGDQTSPPVAIPVPGIRLQEFLPDAQRIGQGVQVGIGDWQARLESNKNAYALEFVQRQRFIMDYPLTMTPSQVVDKLNMNAGEVLSPSERQHLIDDLALATSQDINERRASVVRKVADNAELRRREQNRAFVLMQYFGYLRRNPNDPPDTDFRGWEFWLNKLNQHNGNFVTADMVKSFLVSSEYRQRFGP